jgi:hypothetical protein
MLAKVFLSMSGVFDPLKLAIAVADELYGREVRQRGCPEPKLTWRVSACRSKHFASHVRSNRSSAGLTTIENLPKRKIANRKFLTIDSAKKVGSQQQRAGCPIPASSPRDRSTAIGDFQCRVGLTPMVRAASFPCAIRCCSGSTVVVPEAGSALTIGRPRSPGRGSPSGGTGTERPSG